MKVLESWITAVDIEAGIQSDGTYPTKFKFVSETDPRSVFHAIWLDEPFSSVWIEPHKIKHLVICGYCNDDNQYYIFDPRGTK